MEAKAANSRLPDPPLLLITDRSQAAASLEETIERALEGGCRWVLLREKDLDPEDQLGLAFRLRALTRHHDAKLLISGHPALARRAGAEGVHLNRDGLADQARAMLGARALIGQSCHDREAAAAALAAGADYVSLSPIFASISKPGYGPVLGLDRLRQVCREVAGPVVALGGITSDNAADCLRHGARGVAVMGSVMGAADPLGAAARLIGSLKAAR